MTHRPKIAIIGVGRWGKNLLRVFNNNSDVVSCFHASSPDTTAWIKEHYPQVIEAESYEEILADQTIEVVVIATPIATHYSLAKAALLSEKHVFVEKPMAEHIEEAEELLALSKEKNKILFVGHIFLYHPVFEKLQELLKQNPPTFLEFRWTKYGSFHEHILPNLLSHDISVMLALLNETPQKSTVLASKGIVSENDILYSSFEFSGNKKVLSYINRAATVKQKTVTVSTESKTYIWDNDALYVLDQIEEPVLLYKSEKEALDQECRAFLSLIFDPAPSQINAELDHRIVCELERLTQGPV